jgi:hypothetical protein
VSFGKRGAVAIAGAAVRDGTSGLTRPGKSGIRRAAMVVDSGRAVGPGGSAAIIRANFRVAASAGNKASVAACSQGSTFRRARAERTLSCIPLLSSPIGANRKLSNSEPSEDIERERFISINEYRGMPAVAPRVSARRQRNSYSAHEIDDEKNDKKGSKNAATDIHMTLH